MAEELARQAAKGRVNKTIRVMILGIPNVGKSSFINRISKKNSHLYPEDVANGRPYHFEPYEIKIKLKA